jgi:hypothetical protein
MGNKRITNFEISLLEATTFPRDLSGISDLFSESFLKDSTISLFFKDILKLIKV